MSRHIRYDMYGMEREIEAGGVDADARDMQTLLDRRPKSAHQAALWIGDQLQDDLITYEVEHNVITFTLQNGDTFRFVGEKCE